MSHENSGADVRGHPHFGAPETRADSLWKARTPSRMFRSPNVDLSHHPRSNSGSSAKTSTAGGTGSAAAEPRDPAARSDVTERANAEPGSATDAEYATAQTLGFAYRRETNHAAGWF